MEILTLFGATSQNDKGLSNVLNVTSGTLKELRAVTKEINLMPPAVPFYDGRRHDKAIQIVRQIERADGIIIATTGGVSGYSSTLVNFFEHLEEVSLPLKNKHCMIITMSSNNDAINSISNVVKSLGGNDTVRLNLDKNFKPDKFFEEIIEKSTEDFYRQIRQKRIFYVKGESTPKASSNVSEEKPKQTQNKKEARNNTADIFNADFLSQIEQNFTNSPRPTDKNNVPQRQNKHEEDYSRNNNYNSSSSYRNEDYGWDDRRQDFSNETNYGQGFSEPSYNGPNYNDQGLNYDSPYNGPVYEQPPVVPVQPQQPVYEQPPTIPVQPQQPVYEQPIVAPIPEPAHQPIPEVAAQVPQIEAEEKTVEDDIKEIAQHIEQKQAEKIEIEQSEPQVVKVTNSSDTARQSTTKLIHLFQPQLSKDLNCTIQLNITGEESFEGFISINGTNCDYYDGKTQNPTLTITSDSTNWSSVATGRLSAQKAFMSGQIKIKGNFVLLTRFDQIFKFK